MRQFKLGTIRAVFKREWMGGGMLHIVLIDNVNILGDLNVRQNTKLLSLGEITTNAISDTSIY